MREEALHAKFAQALQSNSSRLATDSRVLHVRNDGERLSRLAVYSGADETHDVAPELVSRHHLHRREARHGR
jgi:hypothetical protein